MNAALTGGKTSTFKSLIQQAVVKIVKQTIQEGKAAKHSKRSYTRK